MQLPNNVSQNSTLRSPIPPRPPIMNIRSAFDPPQTLPGCYVDSEDDIVPRDVPMDGSISFFPSKDLSKIYIRQWNKVGDLEHLTYVLQQPDLPAPPSPSVSQHQNQGMESQANQKEESALVTALTNLNQGLSNTFNQFGVTLQSMQQSISEMNQRISNLSDGGVG